MRWDTYYDHLFKSKYKVHASWNKFFKKQFSEMILCTLWL